VLTVQASFVMRHQTAVACVSMFLAVMMLTSSFVLIFTQHINIIHVITLAALLFLSFCCYNSNPVSLVGRR